MFILLVGYIEFRQTHNFWGLSQYALPKMFSKASASMGNLRKASTVSKGHMREGEIYLRRKVCGDGRKKMLIHQASPGVIGKGEG
jgi:hypothetical protein